ncbi:hypothetical protein O181_047235 [Austropuccinia psidii MF-1]|uniref:Uncharacterized protein n=1 Tax=Austropuccinia psidii MF-1 TaxID=1389203 RepID=A0A9Q3HMZ7_9BASI|nr:hypothetical protein [Austropuccinia psidii MF-1]
MEIDRRKKLRFSEWEPESGTPESEEIESQGRENPIFGISSSELHNEIFSEVMKTYAKQTVWNIVATSSTEIQETRAGIPAIETLVEGL